MYLGGRGTGQSYPIPGEILLLQERFVSLTVERMCFLRSHLTKVLCLKDSRIEDVVPQPPLLCNSASVLQEICGLFQ